MVKIPSHRKIQISFILLEPQHAEDNLTSINNTHQLLCNGLSVPAKLLKHAARSHFQCLLRFEPGHNSTVPFTCPGLRPDTAWLLSPFQDNATRRSMLGCRWLLLLGMICSCFCSIRPVFAPCTKNVLYHQTDACGARALHFALAVV